MPPFLFTVNHLDSIDPVLVIVDNYKDLPTVRQRIHDWGWTGKVYLLDQDHYGCFVNDHRERNKLVLEEFGIVEDPQYHLTVTLEVLVDKYGKVTGYSNYNELPGRLRGRNIPK